MTIVADIELRESEGVQRAEIVLLQEGRVNESHPEVFAPNSVKWTADGVAVRVGHLKTPELRAMPTRHPSGRIEISARATKAMIAAVKRGERSASIEFTPLREKVVGGVREIREALVTGVALVKAGQYGQAGVELREKRKGAPWWL